MLETDQKQIEIHLLALSRVSPAKRIKTPGEKRSARTAHTVDSVSESGNTSLWNHEPEKRCNYLELMELDGASTDHIAVV